MTLYELLTLAPVYAGRDRQEILRRIAFEEPRPPRRLNPSIPVDLETIVLKAMAKDPAGRYASAQDLADDLGRFCSSAKPIRGGGGTMRRERSVKWAQRRPAVAALMATVILVFFLGFAGVTWQWARAEGARQTLTVVNGTLKESLYFNRIALAERELAVNNLRRVDQLLADCPPELRGWEWHYLKRARNGYLPVVCRAGAPIVDVAFSPDGLRLVSAQVDGNAVIWDAANGKPLHVLRGPGVDVRGAAFSPDGWQVVSNSFGETMIWDAITGERIDSLRTSGFGWSAEFSPDGRTIASTCRGSECEDKAIMIWDAKTHRLIRTIRHPNGAKLARFSPDGTRLAVTEQKPDVTIVEVESGKVLRVLTGHTGLEAMSRGLQPRWPVPRRGLWRDPHGEPRLGQDLGHLRRPAPPHPGGTQQDRLGRRVQPRRSAARLRQLRSEGQDLGSEHRTRGSDLARAHEHRDGSCVQPRRPSAGDGE